MNRERLLTLTSELQYAAAAPANPERGTYYRWLFYCGSCYEPALLEVLLKSPQPATVVYGVVGREPFAAARLAGGPASAQSASFEQGLGAGGRG